MFIYIYIYIYIYLGGFYAFLRTVECRQESIGWRDVGGGGLGKGPRDGNRTRVAVSTVCAICRRTNHYIHGYKHVTAFLFEA